MLDAIGVEDIGRLFEEIPESLKVETLEGDAYDAVHERRRSYFEAVHRLVKGLQPESGHGLSSWVATANLFGMINWFYQWYDAGRSQVGLDDLAAHQTALFLDGFLAGGTP